MQPSQSIAKRRRWSSEEIQAILADFTQSGSSLLGYARDHGLSATTLTYWRDKYLGKSSIRQQKLAQTFVEVQLPADATASASGTIELLLDNGLTLRFTAKAVSSLQLASLVKSLRAC